MSRIATEQPRAVWCCSLCGAIYHRDYPRCPADGAEVVMAERDPLLGAGVGNYVIERLIGEGGMGRVYLAHHANLPNKRYAFKVLLGDHAASTAMRLRFTREAERASQLDHPNVVKVVDFGQTTHGLLYIVMDYVDGPALVSLIGDAAMPPAQVVELARGICEGLVYAHDAGIVHRDLKPENILVAAGPDGPVPRIVDFGLALSIDQREARLTESGMTMGTPLFAAPEQLLGKVIDHRADLFALGMTMFEMLTGGMTAVEGHLMEVVSARTTKDAPRISERVPELPIPPELDDLVARLTRRKPAERYASAREVIEALDQVPLVGRAGRDAHQPVGERAGDPSLALGPAVEPSLRDPRTEPGAAAGEAPPARPGATSAAVRVAAERPAAGPEARIATQHIALPFPASRRRWLASGALVVVAIAASVAAIALYRTGGAAHTAAGSPGPDSQRAAPTAAQIAPPAPAPARGEPVQRAGGEPGAGRDAEPRGEPAAEHSAEPGPEPRAERSAEIEMPGDVVAQAPVRRRNHPRAARPAVHAEAPLELASAATAIASSPGSIRLAPASASASTAGAGPGAVDPLAGLRSGAAARELRTRIEKVDVSGSLPAGAVERAIDRSRAAIARCAPASPAAVTAHFTIGEARRAHSVRASGATPATSACVAEAFGEVRTEAAPDVGDVEVTVRIAFVEPR